MDLGQLRYFCKIVEHQSFTKAARDCLVSQPALSQQIGKLEKELGQPLFERQGRSIQLTAAGHLLHRQAENILHMAEEAKKQITDDGETGQISISAIPTVAPYLLPKILTHAKTLYPKAQFIINEDTTEELLKRCSNGDIDVGIVTLPASSKYVTVDPLFEEELLVGMSPLNPLSQKQTITAEDLSGQSAITLRDSHCLASATEALCQNKKNQHVPASRIEQLTTVQTLIARDHGISLIPKMATDTKLEREIVYRSLNEAHANRTIAVCFNSRGYQSKLLCKFIGSVKEFCAGNIFTRQENTTRVDLPHAQPAMVNLPSKLPTRSEN